MDNAGWASALLEVLGILLLLCLNGLFALSELAVVSSNKTRLQQMAQENPRARQTLALAKEPTAFLSTVQIGITLIGILAGALSGATISYQLAAWLMGWPWLAAYAELISFSVVVVFVTFLSLIIGELIPKSIALSDPERFAVAVTPFMATLARFAFPLVRLISVVTEWILLLLRVPANTQPAVTEEEIKVLLAEGVHTGVFEALERDIVTQALRLDDISLRPLLTHRTQVHWIDVKDQPVALWEKIAAWDHDAFPLCAGSMDQVVGVLRTRDILLALANHPTGAAPFDLAAIAAPPLLVPLSVPPTRLLPHFQSDRTQMVFAVDEYGGIAGIITPRDLLAVLTDAPKSAPL